MKNGSSLLGLLPVLLLSGCLLTDQQHIKTGTESIQRCEEVTISKFEVILDACMTLYKRIMKDDIFDNEAE